MVGISKLIGLKIPLVLASKSPRRKHLLNSLGFEFEVIPSDIDESLDGQLPAEAYAIHLAFSKAEDVASKLNYEALVLGSDTIVVLDEEIINKPETKEDAYMFLRNLSGKTHKVYTAIALINSHTNSWLTDYKITEVTFRDLEDDEIWAYIESGSPMDKAGAYGIQDDFGAVFVSHIQGCYYNIVGLPLELLYNSIKKFIKADLKC
ncbi:MAG: septum formation protein Maf [Candidatus Kapabacteria bacterium]|nr:septum formation protein Maf [Ignavibacteriota bacterium]MCW5884342.1 septum formation protein Maf [Candidatus Kapabacteria bacterium]